MLSSRIKLAQFARQFSKIKANLFYAGTKKEIQCDKGEFLMEKIKETFPSEMEMFGFCGGELDCSSCKVYVSDQWNQKLHKISEDEETSLHSSLVCKKFKKLELKGRLSCQIEIDDHLNDIEIHVPTIF